MAAIPTQQSKQPLRSNKAEKGVTGQRQTDSQRSNSMSSDNTPAAPNPKRYSPDQITLYGIRLNVTDGAAHLPFINSTRLRLAVVPVDSDTPEDPLYMVIAVIYGYAFEGGCYRCDKPKLLMFKPRTTEKVAVGCGFEASGYSMWELSKKSTLLELSVNVDLAEELVLNANLPGNRNPNTYGNSVMLGHRGGKLTRGSPGG